MSMRTVGRLNGIVYDPPAPGFPFLAVMFKPDGEVLSARVVSSREAGEALIVKVMNEIADKRASGEL